MRWFRKHRQQARRPTMRWGKNAAQRFAWLGHNVAWYVPRASAVTWKRPSSVLCLLFYYVNDSMASAAADAIDGVDLSREDQALVARCRRGGGPHLTYKTIYLDVNRLPLSRSPDYFDA